MTKLVTIGLPVYKRLQYLPHILDIIASQDYPDIELLVSDNGMNGNTVRDIVEKNYFRPKRFRQNASTVDMSIHFNQIIHEASGDYFVLLADDDEITSNYVSELVKLLERHSRATIAMGIQETMDENGVSLRRSSAQLPEFVSGRDFIRAVWETHEYGYESMSTFLARTAHLVSCGGFPDFWKGSGNDDALVIKLCLGHSVALSSNCTYRKRWYESSYGYAMTTQDLARSVRDFLHFLKTDPVVLQFARTHPLEWREIQRPLATTAWKTYYFRWASMYKQRMSPLAWVRAGFALPFIPDYYSAVRQTLVGASISRIWSGVKKYLPWVYQMYRSASERR